MEMKRAFLYLYILLSTTLFPAISLWSRGPDAHRKACRSSCNKFVTDVQVLPFKYEAQTALFKDPVRTAQ